METKDRELEIQELNQREINSIKMKDQLEKKIKQMKLQQQEIESSKEVLRMQISTLEREIDSYKKQAENDRKAYDDLLRERDILNKALVSAQSSQQKQVCCHLFQRF
jgi:hypothetical protein